MPASLPTEVTQRIVAFLCDDVVSLHAVTLIDRRWCRDATFYLWRQTFHLESTRTNSRVVPAYFAFLDDAQRSRLGVARRDPSTRSPSPLFDYPSLLRQLNYSILLESVAAWWDASVMYGESEYCCIESITYDHVIAHRQVAIAHTLFGLFMSRCPSMDCLHLDTTQLCDDLCVRFGVPFAVLPGLAGTEQCLSNLTAFECGNDSQKHGIFRSMTAIARSLKLLTVDGLDSDAEAKAETKAEADANALADLIQIQRQLQILAIARSRGGIGGIVESLRAVSHTLRHLHFSSCKFGKHRPLDAIAECIALDTLRVNHCGTLSAEVMRPLRAARFPRLATLDFTYTFAPTEVFIDMLQNVGESLRELWLGGEAEHAPNVVEAVAEHCPNVVVFEVTVGRHATAYLRLLFESCVRLEVVKFYGDLSLWSGFADASGAIAMLGRITPITLRELVLVTNWSVTADALDRFLSDCTVSLNCLALHCQNHPSDATPYREIVYRYAKRMGMNLENVGYRIVERLLEFTYGSRIGQNFA